MSRPDPASLLDPERYPVTEPGSPGWHAVLETARKSLAERGVATLPGFVRTGALATMVEETARLVPRAHREDIAVGTPYLALPDESYPEGHPRRTSVRSATWVLAYDLVPLESAVRTLYEWDPLKDFVAEVLERHPLYRMDDPLGALNVTSMVEGDVQGWHYDSTDFVVSLALQASEAGGEFECARRIRSAADESYDAVSRILGGDHRGVEVFGFTPGTLMIFEGRYSLHRVSPVLGSRPRYVALMGFDTKPGTNSSDLLKRVRYGRTEPLQP